MAALDPDQRGDPSRFLDPADVRGGRRRFEPGGVAADHPVDDVDLLDRDPDRLVPLQVGRDPHRPELRAHPTSLHPRKIGLQPGLDPRRVGLEVKRLAPIVVGTANLPREVVMAVDDRGFREDSLDPLLRSLCVGSRGGDQGSGEQ